MKKTGLKSITASGHMVSINTYDKGSELISRKEALYRARAVVGMDRESEDLVEALIKAANQARINEVGVGYSSRNMEALLRKARIEASKID